MPEISVIIPVYNLQKYVNRTINSVLSQSFSDFELIVVDDGSNDASFSILSRLAAEDSRIELVKQENQGQAVARNLGLQMARGKFIAFIDGDDIVGRDYLKILYQAIRDNCSIDAVCLPHQNHSVSEADALVEALQDQVVHTNANSMLLSGTQYALKSLTDNGQEFNTSYVSKIFRRSSIGKQIIPEGHFFEDLVGVPILMNSLNHVLWINQVEYYYLFDRIGSSVNALNLQKSADIIWALSKLCEKFGTLPKFSDALQVAIVNNLYKASSNENLPEDSKRMGICLIKRITLRSIIRISNSSRLSKRGIFSILLKKALYTITRRFW